MIILINRPISYSAKEPGSSVIFIHFYTRDSIEWRLSFYHYCAHSKILQDVAKYRSIEILSQNRVKFIEHTDFARGCHIVFVKIKYCIINALIENL